MWPKQWGQEWEGGGGVAENLVGMDAFVEGHAPQVVQKKGTTYMARLCARMLNE